MGGRLSHGDQQLIIAGFISALVSSFLPANGGEISGSERDELLVYDILPNALNMFEKTGMARGLGGMFLRVYLPALRGHEASQRIDKWRKRRRKHRRQGLAHRNLENLPKIGYYISLPLAIGQATWAQKIDENMFCDLVSCPTCNLRFSAGRVETPRSKPEIEVHRRRRDYRSGDLGKIVPMSRAVMGEIREVPPSSGDATATAMMTTNYGRQAALDLIFGLDMATEEGRPTGAFPARKHLPSSIGEIKTRSSVLISPMLLRMVTSS
ncbi:hypothetical protein HDU89_000570 [Geranomyces variabilis]|nr:hypothetical protein HDU89_000570 [Geranomyces variabilis]